MPTLFCSKKSPGENYKRFLDTQTQIFNILVLCSCQYNNHIICYQFTTISTTRKSVAGRNCLAVQKCPSKNLKKRILNSLHFVKTLFHTMKMKMDFLSCNLSKFCCIKEFKISFLKKLTEKWIGFNSIRTLIFYSHIVGYWTKGPSHSS